MSSHKRYFPGNHFGICKGRSSPQLVTRATSQVRYLRSSFKCFEDWQAFLMSSRAANLHHINFNELLACAASLCNLVQLRHRHESAWIAFTSQAEKKDEEENANGSSRTWTMPAIAPCHGPFPFSPCTVVPNDMYLHIADKCFDVFITVGNGALVHNQGGHHAMNYIGRTMAQILSSVDETASHLQDLWCISFQRMSSTKRANARRAIEGMKSSLPQMAALIETFPETHVTTACQ